MPAADAKTFFSFGSGRRYIYFSRPADHAHRNLRLLIEKLDDVITDGERGQLIEKPLQATD